MSGADERRRPRFQPGMRLDAATLAAAFATRERARRRHDDDVHDGGAGGLNAGHLRAALGRVFARLGRSGRTSAAAFGVAHGAQLRLGFDARARPSATVAGPARLAAATVPALRLTGRAAAAAEDDPRHARLTAVGVTARMVLPEPTAGGRVGRFTVVAAGGERPGFDVRAGSVRVAGRLQVTGKLTRRGEAEAAAEVGEAAAIAAWLDTPEGRAARRKILDEVAEGLKLRLRDVRVENGVEVVFRRELENGTAMPVRNHLAFAALTRTRDETPIWRPLAARPRPLLEPGGVHAPEEPVRLRLDPADAAFLVVFASAVVTYDIGVTAGPVRRALSGGGGT